MMSEDELEEMYEAFHEYTLPKDKPKGELLIREVWDMLKYLDITADKIGEICRTDKADLDSLRYANEKLDVAENIIGHMRNQIERPILEEEE